MSVRRGTLPPPSLFSQGPQCTELSQSYSRDHDTQSLSGQGPSFVRFHFIFFLFYPSSPIPCPSPLSAPIQVCLMYVLQPIGHVLFFIYVLISFFFFNIMFLRSSHAFVCEPSSVTLTLLRSMLVVCWAIVSATSHNILVTLGSVWGFFRYIPPKNC